MAPGLAGFKTTMRLHDAEMIGSPNARWGVTEGNPIHDAVRRIAAYVGVHFSVDVAINRNRQITSIAAGEIFAVHRTIAARVKQSAMQSFDSPFDVVVTTNSGYPLDQNLYQSVKGMSAAAQVVKPGGAIVCAAECADGLPVARRVRGHPPGAADAGGAAGDDLRAGPQPARPVGSAGPGADPAARRRCSLKTDGLAHDEVRAAHLTPIDDVAETTREQLDRAGPAARVCVLPEGPQTIPYLAG